MKICVLVGTRPEITKIQPVIKEIQRRSKHDILFIHTGQHYDYNMSKIFIDELDLPKPDYFLNVKSNSQGVQTGKIIAASERVLKKERPDIILLNGDTNSGLGAAIASSKLALSIAYVESGCRSFDKFMPEEINRMMIADVADLNFAPTQNCVKNLSREGIPSSRVYLTGHPLVDLVYSIGNRIPANSIHHLSLEERDYILLTMHRRENVSSATKIENIMQAVAQLANDITIVFPCHPHTRKQIKHFKLADQLQKMKVIEPVGYLESLSLIKHAKLVLTDSGGIQQEAGLPGTPCVTLRDVTEWVETVQRGVNFLVGHTYSAIVNGVQQLYDNYDAVLQRFNLTQNIFGELGASKRILEIMEKHIDGKNVTP